LIFAGSAIVADIGRLAVTIETEGTTMTRRAGFTLIELVVVIMILGILAGVAAPKFFQTSATATDNGVKQSLAIVRDAIELYAANNGGALPTSVSPGTTLKTALAPYIRGNFPTCPVGPPANRDADITVITTGAPTGVVGDGTGWKYSNETGGFIINNGGASSLGTNYDTF
jgi:general secretion pathway protein G